MDAKQQQFQGFRPGTIPPFLDVTYRLFAMDEVAREATSEALEQNDLRAFEGSREGLTFDTISYIRPKPKKKKKKKKKKKSGTVDGNNSKDPEVEKADDQDNILTFESMKEAVEAGWQPGQSFSFVARNVKAQEIQGA